MGVAVEVGEEGLVDDEGGDLCVERTTEGRIGMKRVVREKGRAGGKASLNFWKAYLYRGFRLHITEEHQLMLRMAEGSRKLLRKVTASASIVVML